MQQKQDRAPNNFGKHPWTNGMVEAMNKKIKANTTKRFHHKNIQQFKEHLYYYLLDYNFARKLRVLLYKSPWESMEQWYTQKPSFFTLTLTT